MFILNDKDPTYKVTVSSFMGGFYFIFIYFLFTALHNYKIVLADFVINFKDMMPVVCG